MGIGGRPSLAPFSDKYGAETGWTGSVIALAGTRTGYSFSGQNSKDVDPSLRLVYDSVRTQEGGVLTLEVFRKGHG